MSGLYCFRESEVLPVFIGRERELRELNARYASGRFEFVVIYGRRRVGKTALIREFIDGKDAIYFMGVESNAGQNLENLSRAVLEPAVGASFSSFQSALEYVFQMAEDRRLILAIDEYPYVARSEKSLASTLQLLIDRWKDRSRLMLILCGSSMSYMEDEVLAYRSPLYGRRTAQLKLQPFDFSEVCRALPHFSEEDKAMAYGMVGGTPQYLLQLNDRLSIEDNIRNTFLDPSSSLYEEPYSLLKQEMREPAMYNAVITAAATGASRMSEISAKVGETTGACSAYIKNLISLGILKRELPYGENSARKAIYRVADNMFRFWYRFVPENMSAIARGAQDPVWRRIRPLLPAYMGSVFEEICEQYLWKLLAEGRSPVDFTELGRWWGSDPVLKKQTEIDRMAIRGTCGLFCECKWTGEPVDAGVLDTLLHRSRLFPCTETTLYLFSKSGFTSGCKEQAEKLGHVHLVTYAEILRELGAAESSPS